MITTASWQPADDLVLEPNALIAAKELQRSLALTAGPGAGKTEMLAQRADFLLRTQSCRYPKRILAISFKVDASANLKERVRRRCGRQLAGRFDSHTFHAFAKRLIDRFRPVLKGNDALNFDYTIGPNRIHRTTITFNDLVPLAVQILEVSELARNAVRQTYSDVFLDEFQDCTLQQYKLISLAFRGTGIRLVAVGDTKQKIMGWAGALEGIFLAFADDFKATPLNLYRNFRSKPQLLRIQNEIIKVLDSSAVMADDLIQGEGGTIEVCEFDDSREEAIWVAEKVDQWVKAQKIPSSEIAILISKQPELYADFLMAEFQGRGIPYRNEQEVQDLTSEPVARLIIDYLLVIYGQREPEAYVRLMSLLTESAIDEDEEASFRGDWNRRLSALQQSAVNGGRDFETVWRVAEAFLKIFGRERLAALSADYESGARLDELVAETRRRLREAVENSSDTYSALLLLATGYGVRILTIHKCKGLEFDSVVILGVERETFWGNPADERCAFFVAVSRAKERLVMTYAGYRRTPTPRPKKWVESRRPHREFLGYAAGLVIAAD
jgi:superfamily I DNA/RNA helicase